MQPRTEMARALWYMRLGVCAVNEESLPAPREDEVLVRALFSGVSRGTERLVAAGKVPASEHVSMRAPFQAGIFPFPVKYGYQSVGLVEAGPDVLIGRTVFALHPHQERFVVPATAVTVVPDTVPARRAALAANMETALNALWDAGAGPGDKIVIVGGGVVGLLVSALMAALPGAEVTLVDIDPARENLACSFGVGFSLPVDAPNDSDIVFHTSASEAGLATAIQSAGFEARIVEMSWYGENQVAVPLGGAFHSKRLSLVSSQVGQVAPSRRPRWNHARRLAKAVELLADPRFDALITHEIAFADAPAQLPALLTAPDTLGIVLAYD